MYFEYFKPKTMGETISILEKYGEQCALIAGGTDLIPKMKSGIVKPEQLVNLEDVQELKRVEYDDQNGLKLGAMATLRELEATQVVKEKYRALYEGMHSMASTQIRNTATVAGNICNAVPSADTAPALIVLGAKVKILSAEGNRVVAVEDFFTGVCKTVLKPGELVTEIMIPVCEENSASTYIKYTVRKALELAMVGVAVNLKAKDGICEDIKIGLGAVAPIPKRADQAEKFLIGKELTEENILQAAEIASQDDCSPISDMRATAAYRREMVKVCTKDAILKLMRK